MVHTARCLVMSLHALANLQGCYRASALDPSPHVSPVPPTASVELAGSGRLEPGTRYECAAYRPKQGSLVPLEGLRLPSGRELVCAFLSANVLKRLRNIGKEHSEYLLLLRLETPGMLH